MNVRVLSASYIGVTPYLVEVEVDLSNSLPSFAIVGLGDVAISESKYRIKTALRNNKFTIPPRRIIVNLSPAGIRKEGVQFDLPIAVGLMINAEYILDTKNIKDNYLIVGELSLDGDVKSVRGIIITMILAKEQGFKGVILPYDNYPEASIIKGVDIVPVRNICDVKSFFEDGIVPDHPAPPEYITKPYDIDMSDVKGQAFAKRALEIAAAGGHNIIMMGSPGSGKSMLAKRIVTIMPPMTQEEIIECTKIHSVAGELSSAHPIVDTRPFRSPHHTSSSVAIIGGGTRIMPGEISLASGGGVLFLDELPEFPRPILESLRQPLEDGIVAITRANYRVEFPARFLLVAAANPCNCGNYYEGRERCRCTQNEIDRYQKRLSGPIMDRIDIYVEMLRLTDDELISIAPSEPSSVIAERVSRARDIQHARLGNARLNAHMGSQELKTYCKVSPEDQQYIKVALEALSVSARGYDKILRVARTIADLDGAPDITRAHLLEAISFRKK